MKHIILLILLVMMGPSCGKRSENSEDLVSTTPAISVDDDQQQDTNSQYNDHFSVTANHFIYNLDDIIILEIKNLSAQTLDHLKFNFSSDTQELLVSNINCFYDLEADKSCTFIIRFKKPKAGYHAIRISYELMDITLTVRLATQADGEEEPVVTDFLFMDHHTFSDCDKVTKYGKKGFIKYTHDGAFCSVRALHWNSDKKIEIDENPLHPILESHIYANAFYCDEGWSINNFEFADAIVEEHTNFWGGRKDITIPAGSHKDVCVERNIFGCKTTKVFYSRLISVNCY